MIVWRTVPGKYKPAVEAFLKAGGPVPPGAKTVGRWHTPGSTLGWHLIEGDLTAVAEHVAEWGDLLEILPETPVGHVKALVDAVHAQKATVRN